MRPSGQSWTALAELYVDDPLVNGVEAALWPRCDESPAHVQRAGRVVRRFGDTPVYGSAADRSHRRLDGCRAGAVTPFERRTTTSAGAYAGVLTTGIASQPIPTSPGYKAMSFR